MTLGEESVSSPPSPYLGDGYEHTESYSPFSVCPLAPSRWVLYRARLRWSESGRCVVSFSICDSYILDSSSPSGDLFHGLGSLNRISGVSRC